jgi:hypothetical protein
MVASFSGSLADLNPTTCHLKVNTQERRVGGIEVIQEKTEKIGEPSCPKRRPSWRSQVQKGFYKKGKKV